MKRFALFLLLLASYRPAHAQPPATIIAVVVDPSGDCFAPIPMQYNSANGKYWGCENGTWTVVSGGGGGGTIPSTTSALKGDGSGNAAAVTGTGTNCVLVNGTSAACPAVTGTAPQISAFNSSGTPTALPNVFNVQAYGWLPDDTDRSTAMNAVLTAACASGVGGGTIYFPASTGYYRADSQILPSVTAGGLGCNLRFTGDGGGPEWEDGTGLANMLIGASVLDLRYEGNNNGKIELEGRSTVEIDHLTILDGGTPPSYSVAGGTLTSVVITTGGTVGTINFPVAPAGGTYLGTTWIISGSTTTAVNQYVLITGVSGGGTVLTYTPVGTVNGTYNNAAITLTWAAPLVHSSLSTVDIHDNAFVGGGSPTQDPIVLGGYSQSGTGQDTPFNGYGSVIDKNSFAYLNRIFLRLDANAVVIRDNTWVRHGISTGAAIECNATGASGNGNFGNVIAGNLIELDSYTNAIKLTACQRNVISGNGFWDDSASVQSYVRLNSQSYYNSVGLGYISAKPVFSDDDSGASSALQYVSGLAKESSSTIGGGALLAGQCTSGTVTVPGAATSMGAVATPIGADPTNGGALDVTWGAEITGATIVTVYVCAHVTPGTPAAAKYKVSLY